MSLAAIRWNDAKHAALRIGYPTWLIWAGRWLYEVQLYPAPKPPARQRIDAFREWIRLYPCPVCVRQGRLLTYCDPHHVTTRGAGGDDPANVVPLCRFHHDELHRMGPKTFEANYGLDLRVYALLLWQSWSRLPIEVREPTF